MTKGRYGIYGGQYLPETLMNAVLELERAYTKYKNDPEFYKNCRPFTVIMRIGPLCFITQRK